MQPQTGTRSRQVRRTKAPKAAYPILRDDEIKLFWLIALLRSQAECQALKEHAAKIKAFDESPLANAIWTGVGYLQDRVNQDAKYCVEHGLLPYAHQHTTVLEGGAA